MAPAPVDVFDYHDVRAYLRDLYAYKKQTTRGFSYRAFARRAGLRSPNHLKRVIDGERALTEEMAIRYASALGLEGEEAEYFRDLAAFSRARTDLERNAAYRRLASHRGYRAANMHELAQAAYHAKWYIPAIREMALRPDFHAEPNWIAPRMLPRITSAEAQAALDVLFQLGLLRHDDAGRVVQGTAVVSTGAETRGLNVRNYHRAMMDRAKEAMTLIPPDKRDISSLTFCVEEAAMIRVKQEIQAFRKELVAMLAEEPRGDRVLQLNLQLFPLTTSGEEEP